MKKALCILLAVLMIMSLTACDAEKQEAGAEEGFKPALDTSVRCHISVAGGYSNFEALEAEFDRFNEYYPNVKLMYTKIDDYNNISLRSRAGPGSGLHPQQYRSENRGRHASDGPCLLKHLRHACEQRSV